MADTDFDQVNFWVALVANVGAIFILWPLLLAIIVVSFFTGEEE